MGAIRKARTQYGVSRNDGKWLGRSGTLIDSVHGARVYRSKEAAEQDAQFYTYHAAGLAVYTASNVNAAGRRGVSP